MTIIKSKSNETYKFIKKLNSKSSRDKHKKYILEGYRLISDVIKNGIEIDYIVISSEYTGEIFDNVNTYCFDKSLFDDIKTTINSQGIIAIASIKNNTFDEKELDNCDFVVYLDGISDPGNMGTIIRTCDGAGVDMIILSKECTDIFSPKVIRSTMSSLFNIKICCEDNQVETMSTLKNNNFSIICTDLSAKKFHYEIDLKKKIVIVIGNEANGINKNLLESADINTKIPIIGKCESLNAGVACGIMVYETIRQRAIN